ncbi:hypothetical protein [Methanimicrococcus hongohii]|uniref:hypothetical protein n=1 Tax=Methanimicrococcus hongohii TaxID=3028295 RepID=UPI00292CA7B0|nr:hypothetical protein [Methanimicrococcus sp. Hf6]
MPSLQRRVSEAQRRKEGVGDSNHTKQKIRNRHDGIVFPIPAEHAGLRLSFTAACAC